MKRNAGLTLVETIIVVSLLLILLTLGTIVFNSYNRRDQLESVARKITAILAEAKYKTLAGYSKGQASSLNFGVHFETTSYTLFSGISFNPNETTNQKNSLPSGLVISQIALPTPEIIFEKITGEVRNFNPNQNYLVITDQSSSQQRKISINKLGIVKIE